MVFAYGLAWTISADRVFYPKPSTSIISHRNVVDDFLS